MAAYGVVVIHGLGEVPKTDWANSFSDFFLFFSVPTFLILAFYFGISSLYACDWESYLLKRVNRLLIPFCSWSALYLMARLAKQVLFQDGSLEELLANPVSLLFGSAGVQLYFLPMLFTGLMAAICVTRWIQPNAALTVLSFLLVSLYLSMPLQIAGGLQDVEDILEILQDSILSGGLEVWMHRVQPQWLADSGVIIAAWVLYCLPYIFVAILAQNASVRSLICRYSNRCSLAIALGFLFTTLTLIAIFHLFALRFLVPVFALLVALLSTQVLPQKIAWVERLSSLSFGIYLIHGLLTAGLSPILMHLNWISATTALALPSLLAIATLIFGFSALVTALIARNKQLSQILLGT